MSEAEVHNQTIDWLEEKGLRVFGPTGIGWYGYKCRYIPDLFFMPKYAKRKVVAVEAKGSNFNMLGLLGQLLGYSLYYPVVSATLPKSEALKLKKLRTRIRRKHHSFDFIILSVNEGNIKVLR